MYRLLGSRSYTMSTSPIGELVTPSMDYGKEPCQSAARYFGKEPGEDAPALIDPYAWLDILLHTQPRDRINHLGLLTHTWPWRHWRWTRRWRKGWKTGWRSGSIPMTRCSTRSSATRRRWSRTRPGCCTAAGR